ncbi:DM7 family protein GG17591 [Drosophila obscura]|uniref:DM7 family protein GG17591 n=1 Tax=Drosophila obscura TaxID=7282 RepID=UPI001BB11870|nr:DM7 family protein GG17591 [Drosophila obscura]
MSKKNVRGKIIGSRFLRHHPDLDLDPQLAIIIPGSTHEMNSLIRCQHMHKLMHTMNNLTNAKLRYVPNLNRFAVPHGSERLVLIKLSAQHHPHNPDAAKLMKEEDACICFELPVDRFPVHAPIGRIMFLSPKLLPKGISVGGVFGPGVLPHKFYPIGMLSSQHKGPTPPLFVGRRVLKEIMRGLATELITPLSATIGKSSAEAQLRLSSCNVALGFVGADPNTITIMKRYLDNPLPTQYNIYVPDLTNMRVVMATEADALMPYAMTVISTVVQPHVPSVSMATMNSPGPKFKLPEELFPPKIIAREPVFLPTRFLPKNFEVGCVFAPGALPYTWFHGLLVPDKAPLQHSPMMSPPLFFGRWKAKQQKLSGGGNLPPRQSVPLLSNLLASKLSVSNLPASTFSASYTSVTNPFASKPSISNPSASSLRFRLLGFAAFDSDSFGLEPSISNPLASKPSTRMLRPRSLRFRLLGFAAFDFESFSQPSISNPSV